MGPGNGRAACRSQGPDINHPRGRLRTAGARPGSRPVVPFFPGALVGVSPLLRAPLPRSDTTSRKFCRGSSGSRLSAI